MVLYAQSFGAPILAICENLSKVSIILNSICNIMMELGGN